MDLKQAAQAKFDGVRPRVIALSHRIHAHPELGFEERRASGWLCETLADAGLRVEAGACGLPTAFVARAGSGPLHLAICAEYDALPGIGHACGHNIIAAAAAGAGIAAAEVADDIGLSVSVIGTPAEEVGIESGKILMLERGGFAGVHAAAMVHPAPADLDVPPMIAALTFEAHYQGKDAYARGLPLKGIDAADAMTLAQTAIGLARQHLRPADRVHGVITKAAFVPARTSARYMVRAQTLDDLAEVREQVFRCFEAGAVATGAELRIEGGNRPYAEMNHDPEIARLYRRNAEGLGRFFVPHEMVDRSAASTDMGNVSLVIPSIHPMIGIASLPAMNHEARFTPCCVTESADQAVVDGALAMAWTFIDIALDRELRNRLMRREVGGERTAPPVNPAWQ